MIKGATGVLLRPGVLVNGYCGCSEVIVFAGRLDRVLAVSAASGLFILGIGEGVARLDEPAPLLFWLPTLWGGALLVLAGGFLVKGNVRLSKVLVVAGCALGFVPSVWTLVMPALLVTLAIRAFTRPQPVEEAVADAHLHAPDIEPEISE